MSPAAQKYVRPAAAHKISKWHPADRVKTHQSSLRDAHPVFVEQVRGESIRLALALANYILAYPPRHPAGVAVDGCRGCHRVDVSLHAAEAVLAVTWREAAGRVHLRARELAGRPATDAVVVGGILERNLPQGVSRCRWDQGVAFCEDAELLGLRHACHKMGTKRLLVTFGPSFRVDILGVFARDVSSIAWDALRSTAVATQLAGPTEVLVCLRGQAHVGMAMSLLLPGNSDSRMQRITSSCIPVATTVMSRLSRRRHEAPRTPVCILLALTQSHSIKCLPGSRLAACLDLVCKSASYCFDLGASPWHKARISGNGPADVISNNMPSRLQQLRL
eukprot:CAMPEP_0183412452 /NCGR_PEP_ID=MMETSP0370-20130417/21032_1 /TAXON_ID=268820 /ORGANISM="Peridinium aciculiferum, Strain PAER-2" /LENGTH=333 /DNA_ID=CAMNT_0025595551 /DNA_START=30 /DNA_END=1027 /DNA_ORIENTATION=-